MFSTLVLVTTGWVKNKCPLCQNLLLLLQTRRYVESVFGIFIQIYMPSRCGKNCIDQSTIDEIWPLYIYIYIYIYTYLWRDLPAITLEWFLRASQYKATFMTKMAHLWQLFNTLFYCCAYNSLRSTCHNTLFTIKLIEVEWKCPKLVQLAD